MQHPPLALSVVVPTVGRHDLLERTLGALLPQMPGDGEVLVVIDGTDPDTQRLVEWLAAGSRASLRALTQPRAGQGAARNRGIAEARGDIVLMLDDDILADPGLVAAHLETRRTRTAQRTRAARTAGTAPGAAGTPTGEDTDASKLVVIGPVPIARSDPEPAHLRVIREWWAGEFAAMARPDHRFTFRDFVTGNVSVTRSLLERVGGFDTGFTGYGREDYEMGARLLAAGAEFVFAPAASGVHLYRKSARDWMRQFESMGRADVHFARRHPQLFEEIWHMAASPPLRRPARLAAWLEDYVERRSARGGRLWGWATNFVMRTWYWEGVRDAARDPAEFARIAATCRRLHGWRLRRSDGRS